MQISFISGKLFRMMKIHAVESGHKTSTTVVCECGKRFSSGTHGGYRYHRLNFLYFDIFCSVADLDPRSVR